jgi:hypothetical protein
VNQALTHRQALQLLKDRHGTQVAIASYFGTTQQVVCNWFRNGSLPRKYWSHINADVAIPAKETPNEIDVSQLSIKEAKRIYEELKSIFN